MPVLSALYLLSLLRSPSPCSVYFSLPTATSADSALPSLPIPVIVQYRHSPCNPTGRLSAFRALATRAIDAR